MDHQPAKRISISIVCYRSPPHELLATLKSLTTALQVACSSKLVSGGTIYLIDNSDDAALSLSNYAEIENALSACESELRLLHGHGNIGYGSGHNLVIASLTSDYHLLLNPDVLLDETSLVKGLEYLNRESDVSVVSPFVFSSNGNKQYLCKRYPSVLTFFVRGFLPGFLQKLFKQRLANYEMHDLSEEQPSKGIPIVSGCFMLCRTDKLREVGGFDENYFLYFEDFDLSLRLAENGSLAYLPSAIITHHGGNSAQKGIAHIRMFVRSGIRFFNTYGWQFF